MSPPNNKRTPPRATTHRLVLHHLLRNGALSRSELAAAIGLSNAAMTYVANELMDKDILIEKRSRQIGVGRPPVPLDINYAGFFAIGLVLGDKQIQSVLTDLSNQTVRAVIVGADSGDPEDVARVAAEVVEFLLKYTQTPRSRLAGVGLAMPGRHDTELGICLTCPVFEWRDDVPIARMIADRVQLPVRLDNEVNGIAIAEHLFGEGRTLSSLGVVDVGEVVDAAFIIDGTLCRRRNGATAGPGHIRVAADGAPCECGAKGCLQSFVSESAILAEYARQAGVGSNMTAVTLRAVSAMRDPTAERILSRAGRILGEALVTFIDMFDPEIIMISGENIHFGRCFLDPMLQVVADQRPLCRIEIKPEDHNHDLRVRGAAALVLDDFFSLQAGWGEPAVMPKSASA